MDLLIKGIHIPKEQEYDYHVIVSKNGEVYVRHQVGEIIETFNTKAVEVPEHGRLIEENKAYDSIMEQTANHYIDMDGVDLGLQNAPTVLEASK